MRSPRLLEMHVMEGSYCWAIRNAVDSRALMSILTWVPYALRASFWCVSSASSATGAVRGGIFGRVGSKNNEKKMNPVVADLYVRGLFCSIIGGAATGAFLWGQGEYYRNPLFGRDDVSDHLKRGFETVGAGVVGTLVGAASGALAWAVAPIALPLAGLSYYNDWRANQEKNKPDV